MTFLNVLLNFLKNKTYTTNFATLSEKNGILLNILLNICCSNINLTKTVSVTRHRMTFQSTMDRIYNTGPLRL